MTSHMDPVELGFLEKVENSEDLDSSHFPSKVGGKPAWLGPSVIPSSQEVACNVCSKPMTFLLQIHAPLPDIPAAFHRMLFLFMCLNSSCHQKNGSQVFCMFRCQLPEHSLSNTVDAKEKATGLTDEGVNVLSTRKCGTDGEEHECPRLSGINGSLSLLKPLEEMKIPSDEGGSKCVGMKSHSPPTLCVVCGCLGPKKCSRCKMVHYCSREHQSHDWKLGHKLYCSDLASGKCQISKLTYEPSSGVALPEFEIVTEDEPEVKIKPHERSEEDRMKDYYKYVQSEKYPGHITGDNAGQIVGKGQSKGKPDKVFNTFKQRVSIEPEQVIRYQRGGNPLMVSQNGSPKPCDIPHCVCGAERIFEFQVMPQLLYYLKLDSASDCSVDWGVLLGYSCSASCGNQTVQTEVVWKQEFSSNTMGATK